MNNRIHLMIVTTLSMIMIFLLHCSLKETRATGFYIQNVFIDSIHEQFLRLRCWWDNGIFNNLCTFLDTDDGKFDFPSLVPFLILSMVMMFFYNLQINTYSIRPAIYTTIGGLFVARFCDAFYLSCQMDIFTGYFLIWQIMFIMTEWESKKLPLFSLFFYRGWLCIMTASMTFVVHDLIFRYLPMELNFIFLWISSLSDIIYCLHPTRHLENTRQMDEIFIDDSLPVFGFYYTWDFDDNESDDKDIRAILGLGDFAVFNFMLLSMLPPLSSIRTKVYIAIGHIIAVQIGLDATDRLGRLCNQRRQPAVPLPVITVSIYALLLNTFIEY